MRVLVVLPAYNESENLPTIMKGLKRIAEDIYNLDLQIILVNDGSTDNTSEIARKCADGLPVEIYENERNMGLAKTFMRGMTIASKKAQPEDVIICMDADNSHLPGLILGMVRNIQEGRDVVIASRYRPGAVVKGVPLFRRFLSRAMSTIFRVIYPIKGVRDYSCGYRAYRAGFLQKALDTQGEDLFRGEAFSCMAGILLSLGREGAICGEVPVILRYDQKAGVSKMKVGKTIWQTIKMLARERFRAK
jgi:dolichol-phosphate mannosyltransferase